MIDDHGITVTLTFSTCCAAAGASDFTALQVQPGVMRDA
jgi:hypothetical protein